MKHQMQPERQIPLDGFATTPKLKSACDYSYKPGTLMIETMPMATIHEIRAALFPATNYPGRPGRPGSGNLNGTQGVKRIDFSGSMGGDTGYVLVSGGVRRERHRRLLDFVMAYCPPIPLGDNSVGFLIDRKKAAAAVLGNAYRHVRLFQMASELQDIKLSYYKDDFTEPEMSPLCTLWLPDYQPGVPENRVLDEAVRIRGFEPRSFAGHAFLVLGRTYIQRFASELTIRYKPALPQIFKMSPTSANLARLVLTHNYLRGTPLHDVLDAVGAPTGGARRRVVEELLRDDYERLMSVGVRIVQAAETGELVVFYKPTSPLQVLRTHGLRGKVAE